MSIPEAPVRYREFSLTEIQSEFSPRTIYQNGNNFIIYPLPSEGPIPLQIPQTLPFYVDFYHEQPITRLINPTVAVPINDVTISNMLHVGNAQIFIRCGHLYEINPDTPTAAVNNYRLDLCDPDTADATQLIVYHQVPLSSQSLTDSPHRRHDDPDPALPAWHSAVLPEAGLHALSFYRHAISEFQYVDYFLHHCDDTLHARLRVKYCAGLNQYISGITQKHR